MDTIEILILAPTLALRTGLQALLEAEEDIDVLAAVGALADIPHTASLDVLVAVPEALSSASLATYLDEQDTPPAVLLLSNRGEDAEIFKGKTLRAWGMLSLDTNEDELYTAVSVLAQGLNVGAPALFQPLLSGLQTGVASVPQEQFAKALTPREMEVLALLADGFANKQIALQLEISEHTVKFHVSSIYTKMGVTNRAEAVRMAARAGLIVL